MLCKGSAYCFQVLSDRAFGKLKEVHQHDITPYEDVTDENLRDRVLELERELGIEPKMLPPDSEKPPN